jgi:hypothetical protein
MAGPGEAPSTANACMQRASRGQRHGSRGTPPIIGARFAVPAMMVRFALLLLAALSARCSSAERVEDSTAPAAMNATELQALLRLRNSQPAGTTCAALAAWDPSSDPCSWPGITCSSSLFHSGPRRVTVIDLRYCGITVLLSDAMVWEKLTVLELRGNSISALPSTVNNLRSLRRLNVEMNQLRVLPQEICQSAKLEALYMAYNNLTALPSCIGDLTALNDIWLRGNFIATLPASFCELGSKTGYVYGYMMEAGLQQLPDCIGRSSCCFWTTTSSRSCRTASPTCTRSSAGTTATSTSRGTSSPPCPPG